MFLGVSDAATNGDAGGFPGVTQLCHDTYGPDTRICTAKDFSESVAAEPVLSEAWISIRPPEVDAGGIREWSTYTCSHFSAAFNVAYTVRPGGAVSHSSCQLVFPVACCGWVEIPE